MNWLILTLLAITSRAIYSIATKVLSKDVKVSSITHSILLTTFAGIMSLVISPFVGGISFDGIDQYLIQLVIMVVSQAFGNILFFKGVKSLDAGTAQIAFSSILIWGAILSVIFLGSEFSFIQLVGIIIMLVSILVVQYKKNKLSLDKGFLYIMASAVLFAIFQVASADLSKEISTGAYLLIAYFGPSLIIGTLYFKNIKKDYKLLQNQLKHTSLKTIFASGTSMLYFIFSYLAYRSSPDSGVVVVLLTSQVVLSVILGIVFLKEKENKARKLLAGALAFLAGALIKS